MARERDVRTFTASRLPASRTALLEASAGTVSDRLPEQHRVRITAFDDTTGNPARVTSDDAPAAAGDDVVARALEHVTVIGPVLGLAPTQAPEFVDTGVQRTRTGAQVVYLQQRYGGIPIFQAAQAVRFRPDGALGDTVGNTITVTDDPAGASGLGAADAVRAAAEYLATHDDEDEGGTDAFGEPLEGTRVDVTGYTPGVVTSTDGPERAAVVTGGPFAGGDVPVSRVWFPADEGLVLAWRTTLTMPTGAAEYEIVVDGDSGEVLYCRQTVQRVAARGNVYRRPGARREMVDFPLKATEYPLDVIPPPGFARDWVDGTETVGNAVRAHLGEDGDPVAGTTRNGVLTFDPADATGDEQKVLNIFYLNCYMHDFFELLGFGEADGNFQRVNAAGGLGGDPVDARSWPGPVQGTANMATPPDGRSPIMNMGLVTATGRHTAFDSDVVFHEFMHGVTNRLVGGPHDNGSLAAPQSGGMGEGWGDYIACTINEVDAVGAWVVDDPDGIRGFRYDEHFPDGFGAVGTGRYRQVHNIGEIWCATLVALNRAIGPRLAVQLVVDALKLSPANPSFLNMRDAILRALDDSRDAGELSASVHAEKRARTWETFAAFGMGVHARSHGAQLSGIVADGTVPSASRPVAESPSDGGPAPSS